MSKRGGLNRRTARTRKFYLFRRHNVDLFGSLLMKSRKRWRLITRCFAEASRQGKATRWALRTDVIQRWNRRPRDNMYSRFFINKRLFYMLYHNLTFHALRAAAKNAKKKKDQAVSVFLSAIECRVDTMLFRSGFFPSVFYIRQFIKHGGVVLNGLPTTFYSKMVRYFDMLVVRREARFNVFKWVFYKIKFFKRFKVNLFLSSVPDHLEVSHKLLGLIFLPRPVIEAHNLYLPGNINPELLMHSYRAGRL
jgi:ribosomal protein S4